MNALKISIGQINPIVGNIDYNIGRMLEQLQVAKAEKSDLIVYPEMALLGYPILDMLWQQELLDEMKEGLHSLKEYSHEVAMLVGFIDQNEKGLYNAAALIHEGEIKQIFHKSFLPNEGVFDEKRLFIEGQKSSQFEFKGFNCNLLICEDLWHIDEFDEDELKDRDLIISINASPFAPEKILERHDIAISWANKFKTNFIYVNPVGGQDELSFDGGSFSIRNDGEFINHMPCFLESYSQLTFTKDDEGKLDAPLLDMSDIEMEHLALYQASVLALRDYVQKNKFQKVMLGLSGGVDSALVAAIAVDALGADKVSAYMLPFKYTTDESLKDAAELADNLGIQYEVVDIAPAVDGFTKMLESQFEGLAADLTEENIQSRSRGTTLMALSNKLGAMLLSTGNKSENAMGYATLYGDMCGGYNPIKDVYKTDVFAMCQMRNQTLPKNCLGNSGVIIPENIITKAPSAELRPDQKDSDSLPEYHILDFVLYQLIEEKKSANEILELGQSNVSAPYKGEVAFSADELNDNIISDVIKKLYLSEYKRKQSAPGPKLSKMAFGTDRRFPTAQGFKP